MSTSTPLSDAQTRDRIGPWHPDRVPSLEAFEPDTNFLVRAAAGSGKTTALVARMVGLVRTGVPLHHCTAITFTRKAASEMKARLYDELRQTRHHLEAHSETHEVHRRRVNRAIDDLSQCFIGTIHAFCSQILRENAISAGLSPDFVAGLDEREREEQRQRVWQTYLSDVWASAPDKIRQVAELGIEPSELSHFFGQLCRYPDLEPYVDGPERPPDLQATVEQLREKTVQWSKALPDDPGDGDANPGATATAVRRAQRMLNVHPLNDAAAHAEFISIFDDLTKPDTRKRTDTTIRGDLTKGHWLDSDLAAYLDDEALPLLTEEVVEPALDRWRAYVHRKLVEFVQPAVARFSEHRRESGHLTFQDLLTCTRDLVRTNPDVRRNLQKRYPRLLVDEFQDTDPIQAELLFYLSSTDPTHQDWQSCQPRDGSLFIVGDDKQSIYRFRRADLDVYSTVRSVMDGAPNGADVTLESNFRSRPSLLRWCNTTFSSVFEQFDPPYQASYVPFDAARTDRNSRATVCELRVPYVRGSSSTRQIASRNARQIASLIAEACDGTEDRAVSVVGTAPGDFMVLTRNTTRLNEFADAFAEYGLPYTVAGGNDVDESTELYGLVTLLTCIERPHDPVARVAYLRGPLVGLSDDGLYRFRASGGTFEGEFSLSSSVTDGLRPELQNRLTQAYVHLRTARELLERLRPAAAIEHLIDELGLMARARREEGLGSLHAGRLLRVMTEVHHLDRQGQSWTTIRDELQQILDGDRSLDGMTLETGGHDAIRLLNVHKAKGLEAPVVVLADPYGGSHPKDPDVHVRRDQGEVVLPVYKEHRYRRTLRFAPKAWTDTVQETEAKYQRAEEDRLLYVAATRAEEQLIVSRYRSPSWNQEKGYWAPLYPFLNDVPTIERSPSSPSGRSPATTGLPDTIPTKEREEIAVPSYARRRVTEADSNKHPQSGQAGYGKALGTVVHRLFEYAIQRRHHLTTASELSDVMTVILEDEDTLDQRDTVQTMLERFIESPLWTTLQSAETVHAEIPVRQFTQSGPPTLWDGTIDLVYNHEGGWSLVDFKTDRGLGTSADDVPTAYWNQLRQYTTMWENATGTTIHESYLWCADTGIKVSCPEPPGP